MTSANESGAPICRDDDDARSELGPLCDAILSHDRKIRIRADDTVMDLFEDKPYMIRRSRGWAPLPFVLDGDLDAHVIAVGGELKNSFCVGSGDLFYPSPYVGDLADIRTVRACEHTIQRFRDLLELKPEVVACDLHPRYNSTVVAEQIAAAEDLPLVRIQHHYAHVVSCMAENDCAQTVIGVSFDGTGYGEDGTIWGGEILLADYEGFTRLGHIAPFAQAGGDLSSKEGWRIALALLLDMYDGDRDKTLATAQELGLCTRAEGGIVLAMIERGINCVTSTSAGRLFDAVSAVLGVRRSSTYEGEAATHLQFVAECGNELEVPPSPILSEDNAPFVIPTNGLFNWIVQQRLAGVPAENLARAFHRGLAQLVVDACERARTNTGIQTVALTGGCYQNLLLLEYSVHELRKRGFRVLTHSLVPPNDGGVALGQAVVAAKRQKIMAKN